MENGPNATVETGAGVDLQNLTYVFADALHQQLTLIPQFSKPHSLQCVTQLRGYRLCNKHAQKVPDSAFR